MSVQHVCAHGGQEEASDALEPELQKTERCPGHAVGGHVPGIAPVLWKGCSALTCSSFQPLFEARHLPLRFAICMDSVQKYKKRKPLFYY